MQDSPSWEANRIAASQEILLILWDPKVHYRSHNSPPPVPILSQLDPVHVTTSHFLKIHLNIIFLYTSGSPQLSLSLRFPHQNTVHASPLPHTRYMLRPSHSSCFYHSHNIAWAVYIPLPKIHFNTIFPSTSGSSKWSLSLRFPHQNPEYTSPLPHTRYMLRPSHSSCFFHSHNIAWAVYIPLPEDSF